MPVLSARFTAALASNNFGAGLVNAESIDGGFDEFWLFCSSRSFRSAFSARSAAFSASSTSIRVFSPVTSARSSAFSCASCSYDGRESAGTTP